MAVDATDGDGATPGCPADYLPASDRLGIYEKAKANIESAGTPIDASWWSDETKFDAFINEVYSVAGCSPPSGPDQIDADSGIAPIRQPLHSDEGPDFYCGPGHGRAKFTTLHVSTSMCC